eukprot:364096-Chlamydomonas_euryale.AAC.4
MNESWRAKGPAQTCPAGSCSTERHLNPHEVCHSSSFPASGLGLAGDWCVRVGRARSVDTHADGGWSCTEVCQVWEEPCTESPAIPVSPHLFCRELPSNVPSTSLSGALWLSAGLAQPLSVAGSQESTRGPCGHSVTKRRFIPSIKRVTHWAAKVARPSSAYRDAVASGGTRQASCMLQLWTALPALAEWIRRVSKGTVTNLLVGCAAAACASAVHEACMRPQPAAGQ